MEIFELIDESGQTKEFELVDSFGMNDDEYAVFLSLEDEDLIYILKIDYSIDGEVYFSGVDDDELEDLIEVYEELKAEE